MTYRANVWGIPTLFVWHGGEYVEVCPLGEAVDVLHVWDHDYNRASIQTEIELRQVCRHWIRRVDQHDWLAGALRGLVECDCRRCRRKRRMEWWNRRTR
jgi:hypothetical protein